DSAVTITSTGLTTVKGTANFLDNTITANINQSAIQIYVSKRGSETATTDNSLSEAQVFLNSVVSFQPNTTNPNALDYSASLTIPSTFLNQTQTNTVFLTATITTGDGSTSGLSIGKVPQFVSGTGQCSVAASPTSVSFSNVATGQTATQTVTLTNTGTAPVSISDISISPSTSTLAITNVTVPILLSASQTQTFTVSFTPTSNSSVSA